MEEHKGCRATMDYIAQWEPCSITVSKNLVWGRFGILGIMADYVLRHLTHGDIAEIGVGESSIFLTHLAKKYNRRVFHCDISPGEIANCKSVEGYFHTMGAVFVGTSDDFFKEVNITPLAVGFIDGDHNYDFVKRDFDNMFSLLLDNGHVFIHDMYPPSDDYLPEYRCGDGYRLRQELEERKDLDIFTFPWGAMGVGLTMIRKLPQGMPHYRLKGLPKK